MTQETRRTHVRIYDQRGNLVVAISTDVNSNAVAKDVLELVYGYDNTESEA